MILCDQNAKCNYRYFRCGSNGAQEWVNELVNVYADMEVEDVNVSGNKISFKAGSSGMDDTRPETSNQSLKNI